MAKKSQEAFNPFALLSEQLTKQAREPNLHAYSPHDKQVAFHSSDKKGRLYIGGNRSGKTTGGVTEDLWWITGKHPYRKTPDRPVKGRVIGVDFLNGIEKIILPQFQRWTPPSLLINGSWEDSYSKSLRTLNFENGSFIEFMSYDQDTDKFAGTARDFMHYDEEPPKHVFNECQARLVDTNGDWWLTMTPVEGMTWIFEDIYDKSTEGKNPLIDIIQVDMAENPHISAEARDNFLSTLSEDERNARSHGSFVQLSGLVFPTFDPAGRHSTPLIIPRAQDGFELYVSMDHGWRNPSAFLWHAVDRLGNITTFAEHYASEMTIDQHAAKVHAMNKAMGIAGPMYIGDPAIAQTSGITGTSIHTEYAMRGIPIAKGNNDVTVGIAKMQQYVNQDKWKITPNCVNLISELKKLRWAKYQSRKMQYENSPQEKIHKKDDHAADSARYFFTFMPTLQAAPPPVDYSKLLPTGNGISETYDQALAKMNLPVETQWRVEMANDFYQGEMNEYERG